MGRIATFLIVLAIIGFGVYFVLDLVNQKEEEKDSGKPPVMVEAPEDPVSKPPVPEDKEDPAEAADILRRFSPAELVNRRGEETAIMGRVMDMEGNPIEGASVQVLELPFDRSRTLKGRIYMDNAFKENILQETTTDKAGQYKLDKLTPGHKVYLRAQHPDYVMQWKDAVEVGLMADFRLESGVRVEGRVIDKDTGEGVPGVRVKGWYKTPSAVRSVNASFRWQDQTYTEKDGSYVLEGVPARRVTFMVFHDDYEDFRDEFNLKPGTTNKLDFKIKKGLIIKGKVLNKLTGGPIPNADVMLRFAFIGRYRTKADAKGVFELRGVERNVNYTLGIMGSGLTSTQMNKSFGDKDSWSEEKQNYVEVFVDPAGRAAGIVKDADGQPMVNVKIYVARKSPLNYAVRNMPEAITEGDGSFIVSDLDANHPYRIVAVTDGYIPTVSEDITVAPDETREGVTIEVEPGSAIRGRIIDENGAPVADATVLLSVPPFMGAWFPPGLGVGEQTVRSALTAEDGRYEFVGLWSGNYSLTIEHPEHVALNDQKIRIDNGHSVIDKDFTMKIGRFIEGRVLMANGESAEGATVTAYPVYSTQVAGTATVDESGLYRISGLTMGKYRVQARKEGFTSRPKHDVVADSPDVNFELVPAAKLVGSVVSSRGGPVNAFTIELLSEELGTRQVKATEAMGGLRRRISGESGMFELADLDPGRYSVRIVSDTHMDWSKSGVEIRGGETTDLGTIELEAGAMISGIITSTDGRPVGNVTLTFLNETLRQKRIEEARAGRDDRQEMARPEQMQWIAKSNGRGHYSVGGLPEGEYRLTISADDHAVPAPEMFWVKAREIIKKDIVLPAAGQVVLTIVDDYETPVVSALGQVLDPETRRRVPAGRRTPRSDGRGKMTITGLAPGTYVIRLRRSGMISKEVAVDVRAGQTTEVSVQMENVKK